MFVHYEADSGAVPIKSWCTSPEGSAIQQALRAASLPFIFRHVSLMPDTHQGFGVPIGSVLPTKNVIIPNAVGVDIGCGMCAVKTSIKLEAVDRDLLKRVLGAIREAIPVGMKHHQEAQDESYMPQGAYAANMVIVRDQYQAALKQLGTLGGGNHFVEIQVDDDGFIWFMIHSGSRNLGFRVAEHYDRIARDLNDKYFSSVPSSWDLAFLPRDSEEANAYICEMDYCVEFALSNRKMMMDRIQRIFFEFCHLAGIKAEFEPIINIAHNYARLENHFGENVWVHRKGATSARESEVGIIPGSQGSASYIVQGKGERESFQSCSHGAGRKMGRKQAQKELNLEEQKRLLDEKGILHAIRGTADLEEAPGAYKDIDVVMEEQRDLVDILVRLRPIAVLKGPAEEKKSRSDKKMIPITECIG